MKRPHMKKCKIPLGRVKEKDKVCEAGELGWEQGIESLKVNR